MTICEQTHLDNKRITHYGEDARCDERGRNADATRTLQGNEQLFGNIRAGLVETLRKP